MPPELRIIPDDISQRVRVGLDTNQQAYQRGAGGRIIDRLAKTDYESAYLLSGFLKCSVCGGSMIPTTRQTSRKNGAPPKKYYRCT